MNWLDLLLIAITIISVASSFARGFARELIGLVAAIAALFCGAWFYRIAGDSLRPYVGSPEIANLLGFLLIVVGVVAAGWVVSVLIGMMMRVVGLSWLDRLMGAAFGLARGVVLCVAVIMAIVALAPGKDSRTPPAVVVESRIAPYMIDAARAAMMAAPKELHDGFMRRYEQVKRIWADALKRGLGRGPESEN